MVEILHARVNTPGRWRMYCLPTLNCILQCDFCSANIPDVVPARRKAEIPASVWIEGINRRKLGVVITGGEPFLYGELPELVGGIEKSLRVTIYSSMDCSVDRFLNECTRQAEFLVSLHPACPDMEAWLRRVQQVRSAGHRLKFHVVKVAGWQKRKDFLIDHGYKGRITVCDTHRRGLRCGGVEVNTKYPLVRCVVGGWRFGPDGYRYNCLQMLNMGAKVGRFEHISEEPSNPWVEIKCRQFGYCPGCANRSDIMTEATYG